MITISTGTEIQTLQNQLKMKKNEFDVAIQTGVIFEETKKLYIEMKELREKLEVHLRSLNSKQHAIFYHDNVSISAG